MDQDQIKDKPQIRKPEVFAQVPEEAIAPFEHSEPLKLQRKHPILHEETLSSDLRFIGRVFTVETFDVQLPDGRKSKREIVHHRRCLRSCSR